MTKSASGCPAWIFIDLDDTLWDFSANSFDALESLYDADPTLKSIFRLKQDFVEAYRRNNTRLWDDYHHGRISSDFLKSERFRLLFPEDMEKEESMRTAFGLNSRYLALLSCGRKLVDGADLLLKTLSERFLICVLSNGFIEVQYQKLINTGLFEYVQRLIVSDEIGVNKPNTDIFNYALAETGAVREQAVMIGDNPDADIYGAVAAGWRGVYFNRNNVPLSGQLSECPAVKEISSLNDTEKILRKWGLW